MTVRKRLILRFVIQLVTVSGCILLLIGGAVAYMFKGMEKLEMNRDFSKAGMSKLVQTVRTENGELIFDEALLDKALRSGGWLQAVDETGAVIRSYGTPADVPARYEPGQFMDYWMGNKPFPYSLFLWIEEKDGRTYTLLYGKRSAENVLLDEILAAGPPGDKQPEIPASVREKLDRTGAVLQLLDRSGSELASYNRPDSIPAVYTLQDLALRRQYSERYGYASASRSLEDGRTWVAHVPSRGAEPDVFPATEAQVMLTAFAGLAAGMLVLLVGAAFWYGHRFGTPIVHILAWLHRLSRGEYTEPGGAEGRSGSRRRDGRLKRRYRLYGDVMQSMQHLSGALSSAEEARERLERTRDEWISGISHDLKTPLASIKGYAHMLETPHYTWTEREIREFAAIIKDKADFMDELIGDLSFTFRLSNDERPQSAEQTELNEFVRRCILGVVNDAEFAHANVSFEPEEEALVRSVDRQALRRILDNLVANAVRHNPPSTQIRVLLRKAPEGTASPPGGFLLRVEDNGVGMDKQTLAKLFDRYYRGTNTEGTTRGTGLGMAIARQLALRLGGSITAESEPGRGTAVTVTL
ncbi:sensor histidine kinase KdpD [Paenibacillus sp. UNC499MF]|uniref:sensor histidine kinase n=1 Tax=Paenibacillus sp. UNC499MF TaxID=1502751 RepID=UPI0008A02163|nr:HAMP domain-containing sensor histidine kinase [Paenibacillus sp. UNC499MF]SEG36120.1 His Kinase A (phospho-acceptor) domain-containing protein [Paenibacillus sp. UNC499MF]